MIFGKYINKYYLKYSAILLLGIIALVAVDYFQLKVPELYRMVINGMNDGKVVMANGEERIFDLEFLLQEICNPLFVVIIVMVTGRFLWRVCFFGSAIRVETDLRYKMFSHGELLSHEYYQVNKVGNLMSLFTNDLDTVRECFGDGVLMLCDALLLGGFAIYKMAKMSVLLTVFSLIPMAFMLAVGAIVGIYMTKKWEARQEAFSNISDFAQESFSGIAVIKAFVKETKELLAFKKLNKDNENANVTYTKYSVMLEIFITLFIESVTCIILGYGGYLVYKKTFNAGQLVEFLGYFNAIVWPVMAISNLIEMRSRGKASLKRVTELLDAKINVLDKPNAKDIENVKGDIEFKHLTFTYPDGEFPAINDMSFTIKAGENVGLFGNTGSGKTTIVELILRIYNVPDNSLFIDGQDVNGITIKSLRDFEAYVPQDNFLFSDTIENNIGFATDNYTYDDVENSAKLSAVHDNIDAFPDKYKTVLGERGVTVSGGQKQRISIARALLKDAPILILDDSVSAVDTETEKIILTNLKNTRKGKTTVLIAHRISTITQMDKIIYIDKGQIKGVGTHEELYSKSEDYRRAVDLQKLEEEHKEVQNA